MSARLVPLRDVDAALVDRWRHLGQVALEPNPFSGPEVALPAARWLGWRHPPALLTVERDGEMRFALPVARMTRFRRIPVPALGTWVHDYCVLGTPLLSRQDPSATWDEALGLLRKEAPWTAFALLGSGGPTASSLVEATAASGPSTAAVSRPDDPVLRRRSGTGPLDHLSSNRRSKIRRLRTRLSSDTGQDVTVRDQWEGDELAEQVEAFLEMEARSWKGADGGAMAARAGHGDFFREMCQLSAGSGTLQLRALRVGDAAVAYQCNLVSGDTVFGFKTSYDEAFRRYSPGVLLVADTMAAFHVDQRLQAYDSCMGAAQGSVRDFFPDRRPIADHVIAGNGVLGPAATRLAPVAARAVRRFRDLRAAAEGRLATRRGAQEASASASLRPA